MSRAGTRNRIWSAPIALGVVSLVGLLAALMADGAGDAVSWIALALPVAVIGWYLAGPAGKLR